MGVNMTKSKILLYLSLSFIFGIFLALKLHFSQLLLLGFSILGLSLISVFWKKKKVVFLGFVLIFLVLGIWRGFLAEEKFLGNKLQNFNNKGEVVLMGRVSEEPDIREEKTKLTIESEKLVVEKKEILVSGKILTTVGRYPEYKYGDKLKIEGELKTPPVFEDFNYRNYLKKDGIISVIYYPEVRLLKRGEYQNVFSWFYGRILLFKSNLRKVLYSNLSPPYSFILGAMVLGDKSKMPQDLKEKLNTAGVRHITAVSGMHVVILSGIIMSFLLSLGFWRGQAFYFSLLILFLFILMIGAHPSAIRAGIMGGLLLFGEKIGRRNVSIRGLVLACFLMLAFNPFLLLYDAGFQLSFLAVAGIIYFGSFFKRLFNFVPEVLKLRGILVMTFSAQVFTFPLLIYHFGRISLVTPLVNLLVLPVVYWIMISGFVFLLLGLISSFLGFVFSLPCLGLLYYFSEVINLFFESWAAKSIENVHWFWFFLFYIFLGFLVFVLKKREKNNFLKY